VNGYSELAQLYKALSHPVRLRTLEILSHCEACVCHLTAVLKKRQPYVSQQLAVLREAGLVSERRDGTLVYYRLQDEDVTEMIAVGKRWVEARHGSLALPAVQEGPVDGCPCPHCQAN
jgi:ArsR family transcriptional regulator